MGRKGAEKGHFMVDKKPSKLFIRTASVYPYCKPFIRTTRVYLLQPYPCRKPFPRPPHLSAPHTVYPYSKPFCHAHPRLSAPQAVAFSRFSGK